MFLQNKLSITWEPKVEIPTQPGENLKWPYPRNQFEAIQCQQNNDSLLWRSVKTESHLTSAQLPPRAARTCSILGLLHLCCSVPPHTSEAMPGEAGWGDQLQDPWPGARGRCLVSGTLVPANLRGEEGEQAAVLSEDARTKHILGWSCTKQWEPDCAHARKDRKGSRCSASIVVV